jgi:hypothetical protein
MMKEKRKEGRKKGRKEGRKKEDAIQKAEVSNISKTTQN